MSRRALSAVARLRAFRERAAGRASAGLEIGLRRWNGSAWAVELAQADFGDTGRYYGTRGVCATDRHFVVGFGAGALVHPR